MVFHAVWRQIEKRSYVLTSKIWVFSKQVQNLLGSVTDWLLGSVFRLRVSLLGSILGLLGSLLGSIPLLWCGFLVDDTLEIFVTSAV